jgi:hypothetical protein
MLLVAFPVVNHLHLLPHVISGDSGFTIEIHRQGMLGVSFIVHQPLRYADSENRESLGPFSDAPVSLPCQSARVCKTAGFSKSVAPGRDRQPTVTGSTQSIAARTSFNRRNRRQRRGLIPRNASRHP